LFNCLKHTTRDQSADIEVIEKRLENSQLSFDLNKDVSCLCTEFGLENALSSHPAVQTG